MKNIARDTYTNICNHIYNDDGMGAVIEYIEQQREKGNEAMELVVDNTCTQCNAVTPHWTENDCLVCGSYNLTREERTNAVKGLLEEKLQELVNLVEESLPQRGNTSSECQRIGLINAINEVDHLVSGIESVDLEEKEDW